MDIIEINNQNVIPTEVKYKTSLNSTDYNNLWLFCKKFGLSKAAIIFNTPIFNTPLPEFVEYKGLPIEKKSLVEVMTDRES